MPSITTQGIVLRHADYRENDRMLTLLTPQGRIDALARGCKRPTSPLLPCTEWFVLGEYVIFQSKGHATVTACQLTDTFYDLRTDYDKLTCATYLLGICEAAAQPGENTADLFLLLARALARLTYSTLDQHAVTAAFLLHFAAISGYRPRLQHCVHCLQRVEPAACRHFDIEEGGLVCRTCDNPQLNTLPVTYPQIAWMEDVLKNGVEKTTCAPNDAPLSLLKQYVDLRMEKQVPGAKTLGRTIRQVTIRRR